MREATFLGSLWNSHWLREDGHPEAELIDCGGLRNCAIPARVHEMSKMASSRNERNSLLAAVNYFFGNSS